MLPERNLFSFDISDNLYRSITLLYNIPIEFPNRKRIAAKAAAKAPHNTTPSAKARMQAAKAQRKLCESKPGLYKKVIGVFEAAHLKHRRLLHLRVTADGVRTQTCSCLSHRWSNSVRTRWPSSQWTLQECAQTAVNDSELGDPEKLGDKPLAKCRAGSAWLWVMAPGAVNNLG